MKWDISCDFASGFGIVDFAHEIAWLILKVQDRRVVKHSVAYVISRSSGNRLLPMFDMNIIKINGIGIWRNHTIQKCCIENRMWWLWCKCNAEGFINPIFDTNRLFRLLVQYEVRISEIVLSWFQNKNLDTVGMRAIEENSIEGAFVRHIFFDDYALCSWKFTSFNPFARMMGECFFPGQIMWPGEIPRYILCTVFTEYVSKSVSWIHAVVISLRDNPYGEIVTVTSKGLLLKEWRCTLWTS